MAQRGSEQANVRRLEKSEGLSAMCTQERLGEASGVEVDVACYSQPRTRCRVLPKIKIMGKRVKDVKPRSDQT